MLAKVDELMALCDQLEAQQKECDEQQVQLNRAALARFSEAPNVSNLNYIFHKSYHIPPADLRKTILTLAVQGKLVPQDPKDEPAAELVESIATLKTNLVKDSLIQKEKKIREIENTEIQFSIPETWNWCRFGKLCELITKGSSPKWQGISYVSPGEGILFVTSENVGSYNLKKMDEPKYVEKRFNEIQGRSILQKGDILVTLVGASIGRTAVYNLSEPANINQAVAIARIVRGISDIDTRYLLHYLNSPAGVESMLSSRVTTAQPNISLKDVNEFTIPLPPTAEQHRIVAKVDQLMALVDQLEAQLEQSRSTATNLMNALVAELTPTN